MLSQTENADASRVVQKQRGTMSPVHLPDGKRRPELRNGFPFPIDEKLVFLQFT